MPSSIPFSRLTWSAPGGISGAHDARDARSVCAGTAKTTRSAPSRAAAGSVVAVSAAGSEIPGRYRGFSWPALIESVMTASRAHSTAGVPGVAEDLRERGAPRSGAEHRSLHVLSAPASVAGAAAEPVAVLESAGIVLDTGDGS